jgi:hypothetical protein
VRTLFAAGRLARDLPAFLRKPIEPAGARSLIQQRLETRASRFLALARRAIYAHATSPYRALLEAAGCGYGDLEALASAHGLEGALSRLAEAGVRVTFDDFKRRSAEFDNPLCPIHFEARSGGTRSTGTSVDIGLPFLADLAADTRVALDAHGLGAAAHVAWVLTGVNPVLLYAKLGRAPLGWFYPARPLPPKTRLGAAYLSLLGRSAGMRLPRPVFHDVRDPGGMAEWLAARLTRYRPVCVTTYASSAVRIAAAARDRGLDLGGLTFITLGKPFTVAKQRVVASSGAAVLVRYAVTEAGILGYQCARPRGPDDLHFLSDAHAVVRRDRPVGEGGPVVDAFLFTSLLTSAPKVLLNVETGDHGAVDERPCGCLLGDLGLTTHLEGIRSFEKLSGEGTTFVHTDLLRVLEEVLPARFGGAGDDYQVVETESADGILRLELIVAPRVGPADPSVVREVFLDALGDGSLDRLRAEIWRRAGTVTVSRRLPHPTRAGKILPFHLAHESQGAGP